MIKTKIAIANTLKTFAQVCCDTFIMIKFIRLFCWYKDKTKIPLLQMGYVKVLLM